MGAVLQAARKIAGQSNSGASGPSAGWLSLLAGLISFFSPRISEQIRGFANIFGRHLRIENFLETVPEQFGTERRLTNSG